MASGWFDLDGENEAVYKASNQSIRVRPIADPEDVADYSFEEFADKFPELGDMDKDRNATLDQLPVWEMM